MTHIRISRGGNEGQFSLRFQSHFLPSCTPGSRAPSNEPEEWVWSQPQDYDIMGNSLTSVSRTNFRRRSYARCCRARYFLFFLCSAAFSCADINTTQTQFKTGFRDSLNLSLWHILDAESSTRLVVTMRGSLDVFSGVGSSSVVVYVVYERVRRPLVGWTQEPDTNKQTNRENASKNKTL